MYLCPNCREVVADLTRQCQSCEWKGDEAEGILVALSDADRKNEFFKDYMASYHQLALGDMEKAIVEKSYLSNQADKMLSYYDDKGKCRSILEVGVGQGFLLRKLKQKYPTARITAVDISIPFLTYVRSKVSVECLVANAENLPYLEEFDLVVASDILEHVLNPIDFLLSVNYSLKRGGVLILRVPFEDNMLQYSRLLGSRHKFAHLRNFCRRNLEIMLKQAGFEIQQTHYDGYYGYCRRRFFRRGKIREWFDRFLANNYVDQNDVSRIPNWLGFMLMKPLEMVAIARKTREVTDMNFDR